MLKQRVVTAIALVVILLSTLLAPSLWPLILLLTITAACTHWEWLRLTWPQRDSSSPAVVAVVLGFLLLSLAFLWLETEPTGMGTALQDIINRWLLPVVVAVWVFGATGLVIQGQSTRRASGLALSLFGVAAVVAVWAALVQIFVARGAWYLVSL